MIDDTVDAPEDRQAPESSPSLLSPLGWWVLEAVALLAIVALSLVLRFRGISWGTGYYLHPDELHLTNVLVSISAPSGFREYLDSANSPLNPFNHGTGYVYGTFPLFAAEFLGQLTANLADRFPDRFTDYTGIHNAQIPGRWLSAIADTGTVVLIWWIGRMLFDRAVGLLAALLLACTMLHVQAAHYFTTDSWSAFFATATFAFVLAGWRGRRWSMFALAGFALGLAVASKPNLLAAVGFLALPVLETVRLSGWGALRPRLTIRREDGEVEPAFPVLLATALSGFVAIWTFRLLQPYAFQGPSMFSFRLDERWLTDIDYWRRVQSGEIDYYPGIQWVERAPIIFMLENMVKWGMGPGLGLAALGGFIWLVAKIIGRNRWPSWMILGMTGWIAFHILYFGSGVVKTQRYLLPAYPLLVLAAAMALVGMINWAHRRGSIRLPRLTWSIRPPRWVHPGYILPLLVVVSTVLYGAAFTSIYAKPQTRAAASVWMAENIPDGSVLGTEYWDLGLPVRVPEMDGISYTGVNLHLYADENTAKVDELVASLDQVDYVLLSSNRLIDSITRMPERYPMATYYYEVLFSGELGFDQVAHFTSFPELFGIEIDDRGAEETLTVYDHPEVTIFRKSDRWDPKLAHSMLMQALGQGGLAIRPVQTQPHRMMLDEAAQADLATHGERAAIAEADSLANRWPAVTWYLALQLLALPAILLLWRWAPWLPDRGYALARTVGPLSVAWVTWWLCSWQWLEFGRPVIVGTWLLLLAAGLGLVWHQRQHLVGEIRERWRWLVATEILLAAGFAVAVVVRSQNPDLLVPGRAGTQLQNMAAFAATIRTAHFPAYDPWFAGGTIHDMTFGLVPWAAIARVTGIMPETGYSLALASLATLTLLNAWSAAATLIARFQVRAPSWTPILVALVAPLVLLAIGSWELVQRIGANDWSPNHDGSLLDTLRGMRDVLTGSADVPVNAWRSMGTFVGPGSLEFPLLSYLTGELAVHQASMPLVLAGVVLLFGFLTRRESPEPGLLGLLGERRGAIGFLAGAGVVIAWTLSSNLVAGGVLLGLTGLLMILVLLSRSQASSSWLFVRDLVVAMGLVGAVALAGAWPFLYHYGYIPTTRQPLEQVLSLGNFAGHLGAGFAIAYAFVAVQLALLCWQSWRAGVVRNLEAIAFAVLLPALLVLSWLVGHLLLFLLLLFLLTGIVAWRHVHDGARLLVPGVLIATIGLGVIGTRMRLEGWTDQQNLPLQFSVLTWLLLGVSAGAIVGLAVPVLAGRSAVLSTALRGAGTGVLTLGLVAAAGAGGVYTASALPDREETRIGPSSLDSTAFMESGQMGLDANGNAVEPFPLAGDLDAIAWMRANLPGLPVILEAPGATGTWAGRVSALTGYPTVLGVMSVQFQQRPGMERAIDWRLTDINRIYGEAIPFEDVIEGLMRYDVQYIYVGALERVTYPAEGLAKFDAAVANGLLEIAYENDDVTIYRMITAVG